MPIKDKMKKKKAQARADAKRVGRTRNFATVVYPDSAPSDWIERLGNYHIATLISPLHNKDINPDKTPKKPHYHVLLMFESPKDFERQVKPIFDDIGGVGREIVNSARGYARYLCHLDNAEKAQYSISDIRSIGGADYYSITQLPTDDVKVLKDIILYIQENKIYSLAEFMDISSIHFPEWFNLVALSKGWIVREVIKSLAWEEEKGYIRANERVKVDKETGEIKENK